MGKFDKYLVFLLLLIFAVSDNAIAKAPPPGSGASDVPANIMIMLDTSGSMGTYLTTNDSRYPMDIAYDSEGNLYVAKYYDYIEKYDSDGNFLLTWGGYNGTTQNGKFDFIYSIAIDSNDNIYVSDYRHGRVQKFDTDGNFLDKINTSGSDVYGLDIDQDDNLYAINSSGRVEKYDSNGNLLDTWNNSDSVHLSIGADGYAYIADYDSQRIRKYSLSGTQIDSFSVPFRPGGIEYGQDGSLYITSIQYDRVYKYSTSGSFQDSYGGFGYSNTEFRNPRGLESRADGEIFVTDFNNHRVKSLDGNVITSESSPTTRLGAAKKVIKNIVSDSNLTNGANFGLIEWNSSANMFTQVSETGAAYIFNNIDSLTDGGGTVLDNAMDLAQNYFMGNNSPMEENAPCQQNILIVISDGFWADYTASNTAQQLYEDYDIKTFVIGFTTTGNSNYDTLSQSGGTYPDSPLYAENEATLLDVLASYIRQIISTQLTFTVPTIIPGITNDDYILQSTFLFKADHQWKGHLYKYQLNSDGTPGSLIWDAGDVLNNTSADSRNIWTLAPGMDYSVNNFNESNLDRLREPMEENSGFSYSDDELINLINFIRGKDSYDEFPTGVDDEGDSLIAGERWKLADIYHSKAVVVGPPSAFASDETNPNSESYYRYFNGYNNYKNGDSCGSTPCNSRQEVIYVGSNSGMLHAFDVETGAEKWAFIPPSLLPYLRNVISNESNKSVSIYGVDGSPAVKDIQVNGVWRTVLFAGLRQGAHSYFALDITDPDNPSHLFTFAYDKFNDVVSFWDEDGVRTNYDASLTVPDDYDYSALGESWSDPVITKIEHNGLDKWVAVIGGGYNNNISNQFSSAVYVIDLGDYGKIIEKITISDNDATNNIVNSVPARMSLITPDTTTIFKKSGGIAYFTDLEGNFWKINLTNEGTQFEVNRVFDGEATLDNDRMAYFQPTATLLDDGRLVHYYGTADMMRIGRVSSSIRNRGYAIIDENFPEEDGPMSFDASDMQNVTATESACPDETQKGWFFNLGSNEKITASATIKSGIVIFSRYTPDVNNLCSAGTSKISEHDHACGTLQRETELGSGMATEAIVYKNKLYIGVSSDAPDSGNLPDGFIKTGNLIIGDPIADSETDVDLEYWSEEF